MNFPVFDLHCDTAHKMLGEDMQMKGALRKNELHVDLERASKLPGYAQCFACYTSPLMEHPARLTLADVFEREMVVTLREIEKNADMISLAYTANDVRANLEKGKMSGILTIEGAAGIGYDPSLLEDLYDIGFRVVSLCWNERNVLTGSYETGGGLTDLGAEFVREAQRVGMIVDVSHISDEAFWDIMKITEKPIIATHSSSRAKCNIGRNMADDMFRAICQTGGITGINLCNWIIQEQDADLDAVCGHFLHFLELDLEGKHIALGADLDGCENLPAGFDGVQDYPKLAAMLLERGIGEQIVRNIFWENPLGVMDKCCM